jgi:flavin-binding protein dodecin
VRGRGKRVRFRSGFEFVPGKRNDRRGIFFALLDCGRAWPCRAIRSEEVDSVGVIIIREMVGTSPKSWSDAARQAVATASRTVRNIQTIEVVKSTAVVENGEIVEYRVDLKIGFEYED